MNERNPDQQKFLAAVGLLLCTSVGAWSESLVMTTTYPAPVGTYKKLTTTSQAILARDGGSVGVGVNAPQAKLHVGGDVIAAGAALVQGNLSSDGTVRVGRSAADPAGSADGAIYYNTATDKFRGHSGGVWKDLVATNPTFAYAYWPFYMDVVEGQVLPVAVCRIPVAKDDIIEVNANFGTYGSNSDPWFEIVAGGSGAPATLFPGDALPVRPRAQDSLTILQLYRAGADGVLVFQIKRTPSDGSGAIQVWRPRIIAKKLN